MSPIGRIFIVLNLVLSAAFLGWAANALGTTKDYKNQLQAEKDAHTASVAEGAKKLQDKQKELDVAVKDQSTFREGRDLVQAQADQLRTQLDELKRSNDSLQGNLTKIQATLGDYNGTIAQLGQQKDAAVERAHEAERARDAAVQAKDAAEIAQRDAEEATHNAQTRIGDLEGEKVALADEVDTYKTRLEVLFAKTNIRADEVFAQPAIEAYVLDVKRDLKLVILNKGAKDGVKTGFTFDIYRGSQYKGQLRISDVQDGISSGQILSEKSAISKGDSATTSL